MKKLISLFVFFVLIASCSSDKDTRVELPDNNIEKTNNLVNQSENNIRKRNDGEKHRHPQPAPLFL